ncbi:MBL fold metallo-hydrolase [Chitinophaga sp. CB10]|uniref:MBL fold metallo-hydrolase n=1 Tax=Chitinophaga sp. CB10 TaxID=1891659 RepID=UPI000A9E9793|nr:MBL fold metallo-hydrolase [Chitinophaga sp. CB10]
METTIICATCGTQYQAAPADNLCFICKDDRQYLPEGGQQWTTPAELAATHRVQIRQLEPALFELQISPKFGIGQRALLVLHPEGNLLWDCIPLLDQAAVDFIREKGGLRGIAISHPHYYSNMRYWAQMFDCPVYLHEKDKSYIVDHHPRVHNWAGTTLDLSAGLRIVNTGGHFPGSCVLLTGDTLLCGDTMYLSPSMRHLAVMYSYPNRIPLPVAEARAVMEQIMALPFSNLYGFFDYQQLHGNAKQILQQSMDWYQS